MGNVNGSSFQCAVIRALLFTSAMADDLRHLKIRVGKGLE